MRKKHRRMPLYLSKKVSRRFNPFSVSARKRVVLHSYRRYLPKRHVFCFSWAGILDKASLFFLAKFGLFFSIPYVLIHVVDMRAITGFIASVEAALLTASGVGNSISGSLISAPPQAYEIVPDCSGFVLISAFAALAFASRTTLRKQVASILLFSPVLFAFNILRLFATLWVGVRAPAYLEAAHFSFWFIDGALVILLWLAAVKYVVKPKNPAELI